MAISTFNTVVTSTDQPYQYLAKARNFKMKFAGKKGNLKDSITPQEGIMVALGSCETIVTSGVLDANHKNANNYTLGVNLENNIFHVNFYLDQKDLFSKIKEAIKNGSPVYDNMTREIPISVSSITIEKD